MIESTPSCLGVFFYSSQFSFIQRYSSLTYVGVGFAPRVLSKIELV